MNYIPKSWFTGFFEKSFFKNKYNCSGPMALKSGGCRLKFPNWSCYKQTNPISDVNYINKEY